MSLQESDELRKLYTLISKYYTKNVEGKNSLNERKVTVEIIADMFEELTNNLQKYKRDLEDTSLALEANLEEISNTYDLLSSLLEITDVLSKSINPFEVVMEVVKIISNNVPSEEMALFVVDEGKIKKFSENEAKHARSFFNAYMLSEHKVVLDEENSLLAVPIEANEFYGAFVCLGKKNGPFYTAADRKLVESAAKQLKVAFSNYRYFRMEVKRAAIQRELSIAYDIQQSLFPKIFPKKFSVAGVSIPAHDVGGDYYDAFELNGKLFVTVADISGKGIPAAIIMSSFRSYLKGIVRSSKNLEELSNNLNHLISSDISEDRFVTAVIGVFDPKSRTFEYVNAGHDPIIYVSDGKSNFLDSDGVPFGIIDKPKMYRTKTIDVKAGDVLVIYTDGIAEARNLKKEEYGLERLNGFVRKFSKLSPQEMLEMLMEDVENFSLGAEQHDDITALIAKM